MVVVLTIVSLTFLSFLMRTNLLLFPDELFEVNFLLLIVVVEMSRRRRESAVWD